MEDIINYIDGQVQIIFERGSQPLHYRDAIWMSEAEYAATSREAILAIQEQRYSNWLAIVSPETVTQ
jgi:hypothetical protein